MMLLCENDGRAWLPAQLNAAKKINHFLYSRYFLIVLTLLAVLGHFCEIELAVYWVYTAIAVYMALFGRDFLLLIPLTVNCYLMPSPINNPGKHAESIFYMDNGAYQLAIMAVLIACAVLTRLIFDTEIGFRNMRRVKFKLLGGILALSGAYLLSGIGSEKYTESFSKNIGFALLQVVAVFALYFILSFTVKWRECDKRYFCYVLVLMGFLIGAELLNVYLRGDVITQHGVNKLLIYVGWGVSINIGMHFALAIPAAFYFVYKGEGVILYNVAAILLCLFSIPSASRAAVCGAAAVYGGCALFVCLKGRTKLGRWVTLACAAVFAGVGVGALLSTDIISYTFANGLQSDSRLELYRFGLEIFGKDPVFGNGFFNLDDSNFQHHIWEKLEAFADGFPNRWHNTVIQLLACCGVTGFGAYVFHRYQTVRLFLTRINTEKIFIGISVLTLLLLSLVDCHFFNIGPVLIYSAALAFVEGMEETPPETAAPKAE